MTGYPKTQQLTRAKKESAQIPRLMKERVIQRDGGVCVLALKGCTHTATTADHLANRGQGGSPELNDPANLVAACALCNGRKEDATGDERADLVRRGLRVEKASTNEATLEVCRNTIVTYPHGDRFLLSSDYRRMAVI